MRRISLPGAGFLVLAIVLALVLESSAKHHTKGSPSPRPRTATRMRLLPLRAADPGGGAPWGMRLVRTPGGLLCAQVARVMAGVLGQLGVDGAFGDDGHLHALAEEQSPEVAGTVGVNTECVAAKETFSGTIHGLDRNAVDNPGPNAGPLTDRREIGFGLLGPHAIAISYDDGSKAVTEPVLRGLGAFLVVRTARFRRYLGMIGAAPGSDYSDDLAPAGPTGFLDSITYRYGKTVCRDNGHDAIGRCHLSNRPLGPERTPSQGG